MDNIDSLQLTIEEQLFITTLVIRIVSNRNLLELMMDSGVEQVVETLEDICEGNR